MLRLFLHSLMCGAHTSASSSTFGASSSFYLNIADLAELGAALGEVPLPAPARGAVSSGDAVSSGQRRRGGARAAKGDRPGGAAGRARRGARRWCARARLGEARVGEAPHKAKRGAASTSSPGGRGAITRAAAAGDAEHRDGAGADDGEVGELGRERRVLVVDLVLAPLRGPGGAVPDGGVHRHRLRREVAAHVRVPDHLPDRRVVDVEASQAKEPPTDQFFPAIPAGINRHRKVRRAIYVFS